MADASLRYFRGLGKFDGISSSVLKITAITAMVLDHMSVLFFGAGPTVFRIIGRIAFPIFAFMISEGVRYSGNIRKYAVRLFAFALISEIPFDVGMASEFIDFSKQNVYFTLLLGLLSSVVLKKLKEKNLTYLGIFTTVIFALTALIIKSDYGFTGVAVISVYYLFGELSGGARVLAFAAASLLTCIAVTPGGIGLNILQIPAVFSVIPIVLYNGKKGFKMNKYIFYAFYPVHISILTILARVICRG